MFRRKLSILILPLVAALAFAASPARTLTAHATSDCGWSGYNPSNGYGYANPTYTGGTHAIQTGLQVQCSGGYIRYGESVNDVNLYTANGPVVVNHIRYWICGQPQPGIGTNRVGNGGWFWTPWYWYGSCGAQADTYGAYDYDATEYYYYPYYIAAP